MLGHCLSSKIEGGADACRLASASGVAQTVPPCGICGSCPGPKNRGPHIRRPALPSLSSRIARDRSAACGLPLPYFILHTSYLSLPAQLRGTQGLKSAAPKLPKTENTRLSSTTDLTRREHHFHELSRAEGPKGQTLEINVCATRHACFYPTGVHRTPRKCRDLCATGR